jgi:hypothetical protein
MTTTVISPVRIAEGCIARAKKDQGIDFHHLNSCFTLTAQFSDGVKVGAHFTHFVKEGLNIYKPKDLLSIFGKVIASANTQSNPLVSIKMVGFLSFWHPSQLGIKLRDDSCLSNASPQRAIAEFLQVPVEKIQVKDTSFKERVYLSIAADGSVIFKEKDEDKENVSET